MTIVNRNTETAQFVAIFADDSSVQQFLQELLEMYEEKENMYVSSCTFLAVQDSSIGDLVTHSLSPSVRDF